MIHPSAIIDKTAKIDSSVHIGPYCIIEKNVQLAAGNYLHSQVYIGENSSFDKDNEFFPFSSIGLEPQDKKYKKGDSVFLEVGSNNVFRENVTVNRGTLQDKVSQGRTKIGNNNLLMAYVHIAHDCLLENDIIMANNVSLAGHVKVQSNVNFGGFCLINQFRTIGQNVFVGMGCAINKNLIPFMSYSNSGSEIKLRFLNSVGLSRLGYDKKIINRLTSIPQIFLASDSTNQFKKQLSNLLKENPDLAELKIIYDFINHPSTAKYGIHCA